MCLANVIQDCLLLFIFFFKQKTAYELRISDLSSDVCSSDLDARRRDPLHNRRPMSTSLKLQQQPKAPPYSLEAEQSVLGGLMLENRHWDDLADKLGADDFYREDHQKIGRASCRARVCQYV